MRSRTRFFRRRGGQRLFLLVAALLLALPGLLTIGQPPNGVSALERRRLADWPKPPGELAQLRAWPTQVEAWLADHVGQRDRLIAWMGRLRYLLREPGGTRVVFGRDGTLFLADAARLRIAAGQAWLDAAMRSALLRLLEGWAATAEVAGVPLLVMIVPDKETLRSPQLPWWARRFDSEPALDQLLVEIRARGRVPLLDLRPALRAAPAEHPIFLDEDTHWTGYGAYLAYRALIEVLRPHAPDLRSLSGDAVVWGTWASGQELRRMLGLPADDTATVVKHPAPAQLTYRQLPAEALPDGRQVQRFERPGAIGPRLLFLHDSFGLALLPWLAESAPQMVATSYFPEPGLAALLRRYPSDLVVIEMIERNLGDTSRRLWRQ